MPLCMVITNVPDSLVPEGFEVKLSELLAKVLSKPIERITVGVQAGQRLIRAGTDEPTCLCKLSSIAVFSPGRNPEYAAQLYPFISQNLGIKRERVVLLFQDVTADQLPKAEY